MPSLPTSLFARILIGATVVTVPTVGVVTYSQLRESASGPAAATAPAPAAAPTPSALSPEPATPTDPPLSTPTVTPTAPPVSVTPSARSAPPSPYTTSRTPAARPSASSPAPTRPSAPVSSPPVVTPPPSPIPPAPAAPTFSAAAVPTDVRTRLVAYASSGLLAYDGGDTFSPQQQLNRQDFAVVMVDLLGLDRPATVTGSFSDVPSDAFAGAAIDALTGAGLIHGVDANHFAPAANLTRADLAVLLAKGLNLPAATSMTPTFTDVPVTHYAFRAIESVTEAGVMRGLEAGTFGPTHSFTRAELAVTLVRALNLPVDDTATSPFVDVPGDSYFSLYVPAAVNAGLMRPVDATHFDPTGPVTRTAAALVFTQGLNLPVPQTSSSSFADVTSKYYAGQAIEAAVSAGLMKPASSTVFDPTTVLTLPQESTLFTGAMTFAATGSVTPAPTP
ncbi:MAG: S-layer homology domain-containing protein [Angustibacter sp.]